MAGSAQLPIESKLTRIGIFYDGNYFAHVSNYYMYQHDRRARISVSGLHEFIRHQVAHEEGEDVRFCQIVDSHYFRGRLPASVADERDLLRRERTWEDILIREGVVTHYLPMSPAGEKGIDVWFALEAFELAVYKRFNVSVIVGCDGDYVPLVRKLNTLGTRVMALAWDFKYVDENQITKETRTSQALLNEVTYPVMMHTVIDDRSKKGDALINGLFVARKDNLAQVAHSGRASDPSERIEGTIVNLLAGFGFIRPDIGGENIFFYHQDVIDNDFNALNKEDRVSFVLGKNAKGPCATQVRLII
jgi:cold shock CspA family protein